jgi:hypothetical protein
MLLLFTSASTDNAKNATKLFQNVITQQKVLVFPIFFHNQNPFFYYDYPARMAVAHRYVNK